MDADIKKLKEAYIEKKREASSLSEKRQIRHDYKVMKKKLKDANRIIKKNNLLESPDEFWDKFDFPSFDDYKKNNMDIETDESLKEMNETLEASKQQFEEQKKHSDEVIRQADETIKQIDEKLAELEKKESLEKTKQDYNNWKSEVLNRINSEEYQNLEQAKEKAKTFIKNDNDLTSIWEKDEKYYVVLSRDREQAFRNNYKEVVKYNDLVEEKTNLFEKDSNGAYIRLIIPSDFVKLILGFDNNKDIDFRGKKDLDLTTDEVIVLKKYAYELSENKEKKMDTNITFEEAKKIADEKAKEWNKEIVGISENDEYWLFNADNDSHPIDDGAGSCYISKKDGSIRELNRWDMEFTKKFNETAKDLLVRTSLSELYGYHSKNNIADEKSALEYINNIINVLSKYSFNSDDNFVLLGRKKFVYDEINDILKGNKEVDNPIYFVLGSLEEFICNNNFVYMSDGDQWEKAWEDLRNRNDMYSKNNIICLEEKNVIEDIVNKIKDYIESK